MNTAIVSIKLILRTFGFYTKIVCNAFTSLFWLNASYYFMSVQLKQVIDIDITVLSMGCNYLLFFGLLCYEYFTKKRWYR